MLCVVEHTVVVVHADWRTAGDTHICLALLQNSSRSLAIQTGSEQFLVCELIDLVYCLLEHTGYD